MKIRNGFVSNSSSSSFLVCGIYDADSINSVLMKNGIIYKDGLAENVLDETAIYELYKVKLNEQGHIYAVD